MNYLNDFKDFLLQEKHISSEVTIKNYISDVKKFIEWNQRLQENFDPKNITPELIDLFKKDSLSIFSAQSVERYLSSLRNFFAFLLKTGEIQINPFETSAKTDAQGQDQDPWNLRQFKSNLFLYNASPLTIKNYLLDVKQFMHWASNKILEENPEPSDQKNIFKYINTNLINTYKATLTNEDNLSISSINRKLSSLRRYTSWLRQVNLIGEIKPQIVQKHTDISQNISSLLSLETPLQILEKKKLVQSDEKHSFSKIPPIRVVQKSLRGLNFLLEKILITPVVGLLLELQYKIWETSGKQIFSTEKGFIALLNRFNTKQINQNISKVRNIPKILDFEDTSSVSALPLLQRIWITARYKRPNWYKRYHKYAFVHFFHFAVLFIFCSIVGFSFYTAFFKTSQNESAVLAEAITKQRTIPYMIRLTDTNNNPITTSRNIRFTIYNDPVASDSGSHRLWEELVNVKPNKDGVFNVLLGSSGYNTAPGNAGHQTEPDYAPVCQTTQLVDHACGIPESLFTTSESLYLGVTVENDPELTPRNQIASVSLAHSSETLQGLIPTTDSTLTGNTNAILALNASGTVAISGKQTTTIQALQGQLVLSGNGLSLQTASGSNNNITLSPDGAGYIDVQKPLINSTNYSNLFSPSGSQSAAGAVEVDDLFAVLATSSGQSAFTINQNGNGPIISASRSGIAKFTVDSDGNVFVAGTLSSSSIETQTLGISGNVTSSVIPANGHSFDLGSGIKPWKDVYAENFYAPQNGGVAGYFQLIHGVLSPTSNYDLLVGGAATESAPFQVVGSGTNAGDIKTAGNLFFNGANPTMSMLNGRSFNLQTSPDSNNNLTSRFFVGNNGNIGFGTVTPRDLIEAKGDIRIGAGGTNGCIKDASGGLIAGTCSSDIRLKKDIQTLPSNILDKIVSLEPVTFNWRSSEYPQFGFGDQTNYGLIAQQVESVFPQLVEDNGPGGFKAVKYQLLPIFLLEGLREQQMQIESLKTTVADLSVTDGGNLSIVPDIATENFLVTDGLGNVTKTIGKFAELFVGNFSAGVIHSQQIVTQNITVAGQSLQDYILAVVRQANFKNATILSPVAEVDELHTHILSPIGNDGHILVVLNNNSLEIKKDASSSASTIIDNNGNASFSGTLASNNLAVNNVATISGTLYAHKIIADEIETSNTNTSTNSSQNITNINNVYYINPTPTPINSATPSSQFLAGTQTDPLPTSFVKIGSVSGELIDVPSLHATTAQFDQGLMSFGPTSLSDTSITGQLAIGAQLILVDNSINVLGGDLQLQPLGQGGISIAGGKVRFDNNGNLMVNGTAVFNNGIYANVLSPIPGQDLVVSLGDDNGQKMIITGASGSAVLSINSIGDLIASGAASISKLNLTNLVTRAEAVSDIEIVATGSAGTTQINPYRREVTIDNTLVTDKSLIYISPIGNSTEQPVLLRQVPGTSFTVGIRQYITVPTKFNWLIIN